MQCLQIPGVIAPESEPTAVCNTEPVPFAMHTRPCACADSPAVAGQALWSTRATPTWSNHNSNPIVSGNWLPPCTATLGRRGCSMLLAKHLCTDDASSHSIFLPFLLSRVIMLRVVWDVNTLDCALLHGIASGTSPPCCGSFIWWRRARALEAGHGFAPDSSTWMPEIYY